jgi:DNA polymerase-4
MSNILPIKLSSWPNAIMHLDADAFFASVEQAINPRLKGKPVITGAERGIVAALSYEAKAKGIKRGMRLFEAREKCPQVICLPSDYETYSIFSKRIFSIMRRFTPVVEEYSIDEGFADLSGLRRLYKTSFKNMAYEIKNTVEKELGIPVSVGVSLSKTLAKICSKLEKPSGLVVVKGPHLNQLLEQTTLNQVCGFGSNLTALLNKQGLHTALDYVKWPEVHAKKLLGKIGVELHRELSGTEVYPVTSDEKTTYVTISKVKTFTPPSSKRGFVYAQALKNLEAACIKARRYHLQARRLTLFLRQFNFRDAALEVKLSRPTSATLDLVNPFQKLFDLLYQKETQYRSTGVVLGDLTDNSHNQLNLFEDPVKIIKVERVYEAIDAVNARHGKHKVHLAESLPAQHHQHTGSRALMPGRKTNLLFGENFRQRVGLPVLRH